VRSPEFKLQSHQEINERKYRPEGLPLPCPLDCGQSLASDLPTPRRCPLFTGNPIAAVPQTRGRDQDLTQSQRTDPRSNLLELKRELTGAGQSKRAQLAWSALSHRSQGHGTGLAMVARYFLPLVSLFFVVTHNDFIHWGRPRCPDSEVILIGLGRHWLGRRFTAGPITEPKVWQVLYKSQQSQFKFGGYGGALSTGKTNQGRAGSGCTRLCDPHHSASRA
jgi:hypothetical protein